MESFEKGELTVSFELMVDESNVTVVDGGYKKLSRVSFDGVGLLVSGETPACSAAMVFETAKKIIEDVFSRKDKNLIYASAKNITKNWVHIGELIEKAITDKENKNEGEIEMDEKAKKALLAKQKGFIVEEFGKEAVKDWTDEDYLNQDKIDALRESVKVEKEAVEKKSKEAKKIPEDAEKRVSEYLTTIREKITYDTETGEERIETETDYEVKYDGETSFVKREKSDTVYTYAQVEELKAENERAIVAKNAEIGELNKTHVEALSTKDSEFEAKSKEVDEKHQAELATKELAIKDMEKEVTFIKDNAMKIVEIRAELGDFVKDLSDEQLFDETMIEIAKLKKENAELRAGKEIETASTTTKIDLTASINNNDEEDSEEMIEAKKKVAKKKVMKQVVANLK